MFVVVVGNKKQTHRLRVGDRVRVRADARDINNEPCPFRLVTGQVHEVLGQTMTGLDISVNVDASATQLLELYRSGRPDFKYALEEIEEWHREDDGKLRLDFESAMLVQEEK